MNQYILDNSAFTYLFNNDDYVAALKKTNIRIIIPKETYIEAHGGIAEYIYKRMDRLASIVRGPALVRIDFSESLENVLKLEASRDGKLDNIPVLNPQDRMEHIRILSDRQRFEKFHKDELKPRASAFAEIKEEILAIERREDGSPSGISQEAWRHLALTFKGIQNYDELFKEFLVLTEQILPKNKLMLIWSNPSAYSYMKAYLNLLCFRSLGNHIRKYYANDPLSFFQGFKNGNWHDLKLIAYASSKAFLVTTDVDQKNMHNFLHKNGVLTTIAIEPNDLIRISS